MSKTQVIDNHLDDQAADQVRRSASLAIKELQTMPAADLGVIPGIQLVDGVDTPIAHKLGRSPRWVGPSVPRGAIAVGLIREQPSTDRARTVILRATGFGATITIDLAVM